MSCKLIIDNREKYVLRHEKELEKVNFEKKQLTVGDYAVVGPAGNIIVTIERKSYDDFSASLSDGRHKNKEKLIELRAKTGCRIVYLVEGKDYPRPEECFGGKPFSNIESSIFHLMIRDNITILRTKDTTDTAKTLGRFVKSMDSLVKKGDMPTLVGEEIIGAAEPVTEPPAGQIDLLTAKQTISDHDIVKTMWSKFSGISFESASDFVKKCSLYDIICGIVTPDQIKSFKTGAGRVVAKTVVNSLTNIATSVQVNLLAAVPGISKTTATVMINDVPLKNILMMGEGNISGMIVGKNNRKVGAANAAKIVKYFNYKYDSLAGPALALPNTASMEMTADDWESILGEI